MSISLKKTLAIMDLKGSDGKHLPFNLSVRTLNRQSKKGGVFTTYESARLYVREKSSSKKFTQVDFTEEKKARKNPYHFKNSTRNILLTDGSIKKIHIRFIDSINGQKMVY